MSESPLPNVAAALARKKSLRILAIGAAPGRIGRGKGTYTGLIERILQGALQGIAVEMINRGVSGELAADAAARMRNEVALEQPNLVLWQVGTNDALAYVPADSLAATIRDQIGWLRAHNVDVALVGLQFAPQMLRDEHYVAIRNLVRQIGAQENVIVIRFSEAMEIINKALAVDTLPVAEQFAEDQGGYDCLAQYVARAITLGAFGKRISAPPER